MSIILLTFLCLICTTLAGADIFAPVLAPQCQSHYDKTGALLELEDIVLIGIGDSLTQGTMDITVNPTNTKHSYMQLIADSIGSIRDISFSQPLLGNGKKRINPFTVPTNIGIEAADIFSMDGIEYYKRVGAQESYVNTDYLCNSIMPWHQNTIFKKVLYPINVAAKKPVSQLDAACWLLEQIAQSGGKSKAVVILWLGNMDTSAASTGLGGFAPLGLPLPMYHISGEINPVLSLMMKSAEDIGYLTTHPYTRSLIERNLTLPEEFSEQFENILSEFDRFTDSSDCVADIFVCTLPYFGSMGYLFDSDDLEFYLQKANPFYTVPDGFKRVVDQDGEIEDPFRGDRSPFFNFLCMYLLLLQGYDIEFVNQIVQDDGYVLSEDEQHFIMDRIDRYNNIIREAVRRRDGCFHLIDIGEYLNDVLGGKTKISVGQFKLSRKWGRGNSFSFDGAHPGYTGNALIANYILDKMSTALGLDAPLYDLEKIAAIDPYVDRDGDGWFPGPDYPPQGLTEVLFYFKDPDDDDPMLQPQIQPNIWRSITRALMYRIITGELY
jgi:hypothetical protein